MLSLELEKLGIAIAALSEMWFSGSGENGEGGYTYYYYGCSDGSHTEGLGLTIPDRFLSSVTKVIPVDECIVLVGLKHTLGFISLPTGHPTLKQR